jgi:hypothetical protein
LSTPHNTRDAGCLRPTSVLPSVSIVSPGNIAAANVSSEQVTPQRLSSASTSTAPLPRSAIAPSNGIKSTQLSIQQVVPSCIVCWLYVHVLVHTHVEVCAAVAVVRMRTRTHTPLCIAPTALVISKYTSIYFIARTHTIGLDVDATKGLYPNRGRCCY